MSSGEPFVYGKALARHYETDSAILRRDAGDVEFYRQLARACGGPALEVGCGTGRVLLPVARAGVPVTGVDPSPEMLAVLQRRLRDEAPAVQERVTLRAGHFGDLGGGGPYGLVYAPFRVFQHLLDRPSRRTALAGMAGVLAPGGRIAFDCFDFDPAKVRVPGEEHVDYRLEEASHHAERRSSVRWDEATRRLHGRFRWLRDGATEDEASFVMAAPSRAELLELLAEAGLSLVGLWADFAGSPWRPADPRELVVLARRSGDATGGPSRG